MYKIQTCASVRADGRVKPEIRRGSRGAHNTSIRQGVFILYSWYYNIRLGYLRQHTYVVCGHVYPDNECIHIHMTILTPPNPISTGGLYQHKNGRLNDVITVRVICEV